MRQSEVLFRRERTLVSLSALLVSTLSLGIVVVAARPPTVHVTPVVATRMVTPTVGTPVRVIPPKPPVAAKTQPVAQTAASRGRWTPKPCPSVATPPASSTAARAIVANVRVFNAPGGAVIRTLRNPWDGELLVFRVVEERGDWLRVLLPIRPNQVTGWVTTADVATYKLTSHITVELCRHRLTYWQDGVAVYSELVATGSARYPTPLGHYYLVYSYQPGAKNCCGPWIMTLSAYSEVLETFNGGIGQVAIHGWRNASAMGKSVSHGCVRMTHRAITRLVGLAYAGTPVTIVR